MRRVRSTSPTAIVCRSRSPSPTAIGWGCQIWGISSSTVSSTPAKTPSASGPSSPSRSKRSSIGSHAPLCSRGRASGPSAEFDVLAFSCSFEMDYLNVLKLLELSGLPLLASERDERYPLVIMGGPAPWVNPEPVAPFIDAIVIGEAEGLTDQLVPLIRSHLEGGRWSKPALLRALADLPGLYIPSLYDVRYRADGTVAAVEPLDGAPEIDPALGDARSPPLQHRRADRHAEYRVLQHAAHRSGARLRPGLPVLLRRLWLSPGPLHASRASGRECRHRAGQRHPGPHRSRWLLLNRPQADRADHHRPGRARPFRLARLPSGRQS